MNMRLGLVMIGSTVVLAGAIGCSKNIPTLRDDFGNALVNLSGSSVMGVAYALGSRFDFDTDGGRLTGSDDSVLSLEPDGRRRIRAVAVSEGSVTLDFRSGGNEGSTTVEVLRVDAIATRETTLLVRGGIGRLPLSFMAGAREVFAREVLAATSADAVTPELGQDELWLQAGEGDVIDVTAQMDGRIGDSESHTLSLGVVTGDVVTSLELMGSRVALYSLEAVSRTADGTLVIGADLQWEFDGTIVTGSETTPGDHFIVGEVVDQEHELCVSIGALRECQLVYGDGGVVN